MTVCCFHVNLQVKLTDTPWFKSSAVRAWRTGLLGLVCDHLASTHLLARPVGQETSRCQPWDRSSRSLGDLEEHLHQKLICLHGKVNDESSRQLIVLICRVQESRVPCQVEAHHGSRKSATDQLLDAACTKTKQLIQIGELCVASKTQLLSWNLEWKTRPL